MTGARAERFVVWNLRLLAAGFALVGLIFVIAPDAVLSFLDDVGEGLGEFSPAPETTEMLWLALGFAYMTVIAGLCLLAQTDIVRYRALLLVLAAGKAASSLAGLAFFVFEDDVFAYLINFVLDGALVGIALYLWSVAGRVGAPAAPA